MGYYAEVTADSPWVWWRFNETGTTATDTQGRLNGAYVNFALAERGTTVVAVTETGNLSAYFDGINNRVTLGTSTVVGSELDDNNAVTFEAWIRPDGTATGTEHMIIRKGADGTGFVFKYDATNERFGVLLPMNNNATYFAHDSGVGSVPRNQWHHVAATWDGRYVRLYVNGALNAEFDHGTGNVLITASANGTDIGRHGDFNGGYFKGRIDELVLYRSALSAARIAVHHNQGPISISGAATLTGTGNLSASVGQNITGSATLTGAGSLSAFGDQPPVLGAAAFTGSGDLSAFGFIETTGAATLTGSGDLTGTGHYVLDGAATLPGSGDLAAEGVATRTAQAFLVGAGSLTAEGTIGGEIITGSATLTGRGSLRVGPPQGPFGAVVTRERTKVRVTASPTALILTSHKTNAEV